MLSVRIGSNSVRTAPRIMNVCQMVHLSDTSPEDGNGFSHADVGCSPGLVLDAQDGLSRVADALAVASRACAAGHMGGHGEPSIDSRALQGFAPHCRGQYSLRVSAQGASCF